MFQNFDLDSLVTPIDADMLEKLLVESNYDKGETEFLVQGFKEGFDIQYRGNPRRQSRSKNLPFSVGNRVQ